MKLQNNISYQMADIHRLKGERFVAELIWQAEAVHFNCSGAAECSVKEGSGDAGTSHSVESHCVC